MPLRKARRCGACALRNGSMSISLADGTRTRYPADAGTAHSLVTVLGAGGPATARPPGTMTIACRRAGYACGQPALRRAPEAVVDLDAVLHAHPRPALRGVEAVGAR